MGGREKRVRKSGRVGGRHAGWPRKGGIGRKFGR